MPPPPSLTDAQEPPGCQPRGDSCPLLWPGWVWALLFAPSLRGTQNVQQSTGGPAAKADVMLSLCHLWALPSSHKKGERQRQGRASPAPLVQGALPEQ